MIVAIGDIHGGLSRLSADIQYMTDTTFVQVGDFGLGFEKPIYEYTQLATINEILVMNNSKMYVIRGNHDNPAFWVKGNGYVFSNIIFVEDNTILNVDGRWCLFAGGAISIDRTHRQQGISYWSTEPYRFDSDRLNANYPWHPQDDVIPDIDIVFAHDVYHPISKFTPSNKFVNDWCRLDTTLRSDLDASQEEMKALFDYVSKINGDRPFMWVHGHYHDSDTMVSDNVTTYSLGIHEMKEV